MTAKGGGDLRGLWGVASIRRIEAEWLASLPAGTLMARASEAVADEATRMLRRMPPETTVLLLAGPGNNGGDALDAGRRLAARGFAVRACAVESIIAQPPHAPDAARAWIAWHEEGRPLHPLDDPVVERSLGSQPPPLVVDGLFGIGLTRSLPPALAPLLACIDRVGAPVLAIDVPSGIDADSGAAVEGGATLKAAVTVTMIADKPGLHTGAGLAAAGKVVVATLAEVTEAAKITEATEVTGGTEAAEGTKAAETMEGLQAMEIAKTVGPVERAGDTLVIRAVPADAVLLDAAAARGLLPTRGIDAHKGTSGDVLVIGGRLGMSGAARLAARGAIGAGAGKVWIAGDSRASDAADPERPEIMRDHLGAGRPLPARVKVVAIGCGLGQDRQARQYLRSAIAGTALLVCDADALNLLSADPGLAGQVRQRAAATIFTPHPLEAARLLAWPVARVQADRITAALELARRFNTVAVVKGPGTIIASPAGNYAVNASGNPVLAAGGTGDVLAGIVAGLAATMVAGARRGAEGSPGRGDREAAAAACCGVWLHGAAGDLAARRFGPAGVPAGVIAELLPEVLRLDLFPVPAESYCLR